MFYIFSSLGPFQQQQSLVGTCEGMGSYLAKSDGSDNWDSSSMEGWLLCRTDTFSTWLLKVISEGELSCEVLPQLADTLMVSDHSPTYE